MTPTDSQRLLAAAGYYSDGIDNDWGPKSQIAANKLLESRASELPVGWQRWGVERRRIAASQLILKHAGYDEVGEIDGFAGPSTKYAIENWNHFQIYGKKPDNWREDDVVQEDDDQEPLRLQTWPLQSQMTKFFGQPGGPQCTAGKIQLPFKMKIAWNKKQTISVISCHEKVADSAERVYKKIASQYSPKDISRLGFDLFGGCYNYRKMRGGSSLSTHAYGIAIDHDPDRNQLKWGRDRAFLAKNECVEFWRAWESEGWLSLGRAKNYDWMHVQAARVN